MIDPLVPELPPVADPPAEVAEETPLTAAPEVPKLLVAPVDPLDAPTVVVWLPPEVAPVVAEPPAELDAPAARPPLEHAARITGTRLQAARLTLRPIVDQESSKNAAMPSARTCEARRRRGAHAFDLACTLLRSAEGRDRDFSPEVSMGA